MNRFRYIAAAVLTVLLSGLAVAVIAARIGEAPRIANYWPLALALLASGAAWWLQGLISAIIAFPHLERLKVGAMLRVYLAGAFVGGISPVRGAEIPFEVYLLRRLGLTAGAGSTVVILRGTLNVIVLTIGAVSGLVFASSLPQLDSLEFLAAALGIGLLWGLAVYLVRWRQRPQERPVQERPVQERPVQERSRWRMRLTNFFRDMWRSFAILWRRGHRKVLIYSTILMVVYWGFRLSFGPLALLAGGWTGNDWIPVVLAQLFLSSFILPLAPTPGGSGVTELGFAALVSAYVSQSRLLSGAMIYAGLTHYLPVIVGAFFVGGHLWRGIRTEE